MDACQGRHALARKTEPRPPARSAWMAIWAAEASFCTGLVRREAPTSTCSSGLRGVSCLSALPSTRDWRGWRCRWTTSRPSTHGCATAASSSSVSRLLSCWELPRLRSCSSATPTARYSNSSRWPRADGGTDMPASMKDRSAIITGGSRGIGLAAASAMLDRGASVCLTGRHEDQLADALSQLDVGSRAIAVTGHAADGDHRQKTVDTVMSAFGSVDVLVNGVGINPYYGSLSDLAEDVAVK